ncbi:MAG TPA: acyl-CoA dehydrogenase [Steroidobacteraceae bacterium]|nr:acyl-CoA dehydrogenase [Steroidobacteraceae bacterium]
MNRIRSALDHANRASGLQLIAPVQECLGDVTDSVLASAARFAREVLSPLNPVGDRTPSRWTAEGVVTPPGFAEAYRRFRDDGWVSLSAPVEDGAMGLPTLVAAATGEMWAGANLAFAMCAEVAVGAIEALRCHAPPDLRETYLPPLVSGEWTASMALTEPQAGSDLSTLRTRAEPDPSGDGSWRLFGRKIYISWGDHDFTDNIVHLVLARTPDAPEGLKGISLFLVPKRVPGADGVLTPNDIRAISLEHKMGIRASPTCAMALGERDGARGWLVGALHEGLACMFTMMNTMRLGVGIHSLGVAERALQLARAHAHERCQGRTAAGPNRPIVEHADVRRMLMQMRALVQAARGLVYTTAATLDVAAAAARVDASSSADASNRTVASNSAESRSSLAAGNASSGTADTRASLLTPIVKAWVSDLAVEVASLGVQVHGGTGYVDDAEISQIYRDARIGPIFEGTNYIQAQDLLARKVIRDRGVTLNALLDDIARDAAALPETSTLRSQVLTHCSRIRETAADLARESQTDPDLVGAVAHHFLQWLGVVIGGWQWCLYANEDAETAAFYAAHIMPRALMHEAIVRSGSGAITKMAPTAI